MSSPSPDAVVVSNHHPSEHDQSTAEKIVDANNGHVDDKGIDEPAKKTVDWPLKDIKEPHEHDVMFGRGGGKYIMNSECCTRASELADQLSPSSPLFTRHEPSPREPGIS